MCSGVTDVTTITEQDSPKAHLKTKYDIEIGIQCNTKPCSADSTATQK
jgi:hypothetical protein